MLESLLSRGWDDGFIFQLEPDNHISNCLIELVKLAYLCTVLFNAISGLSFG